MLLTANCVAGGCATHTWLYLRALAWHAPTPAVSHYSCLRKPGHAINFLYIAEAAEVIIVLEDVPVSSMQQQSLAALCVVMQEI